MHEALLDLYASALFTTAATTSPSDTDLLAAVRHIKTAYMPTAHTWAHLFTLVTSTSASPTATASNTSNAPLRALAEIHRHWSQLDAIESSVSYASWLLKSQKKAKEALEVIKGVKGEEEKEVVERRWREAINHSGLKDEPPLEEAEEEEDEEEEEEMMVVEA